MMRSDKYPVNNPYFTKEENVEVELWYQFPGDAMLYTFLALSLLYPNESWYFLIGVPIITNWVVGAINWYMYFIYRSKMIFYTFLLLINPWTKYVIFITGAIYLYINNHVALAGINFTATFGVFTFLELHLGVFNYIAKQKYNMDPKYVYFKKQYGHIFPFE